MLGSVYDCILQTIKLLYKLQILTFAPVIILFIEVLFHNLKVWLPANIVCAYITSLLFSTE